MVFEDHMHVKKTGWGFWGTGRLLKVPKMDIGECSDGTTVITALCYGG